jgi:pimeloyl-ACP methyl ester carboxylesterase
MEWNVVEKEAEAYDGTRLAYQEVGAGDVMLLCNGLVGSFGTWRHVYGFFADRLRILSWDYRGMYGSGEPGDSTRLRVQDHAADARAVMEREQVESVILTSWSMGVQIAFEIYRTMPERVRAMILICGTYGRPFETAFNWKGSGMVFPIAARALSHRPAAVSWLGRRFATSPGLLRWARSVGLVGESLDEEIFLEMSRDFGGLDVRLYTAVFKELGRHDATDVLTQVSVPTLIIAGEADPFTPRRVAEKMARRIPEAELTMVPGGTHFAPLEHPELINLRIEKFLCDHRLLEVGSRASRRPFRAASDAASMRRN